MRKNLFFILAGIFFVVMIGAVWLSFNAKDNMTYHMAVEAFKRRDYENAFEAFQALANKGDPRAVGPVGLMYAHGMGVRKDEAVGASWLTTAADQGDVEAIHSLGEMYADGRGVPRSRVMALALYFYGAQLGGELARVSAEEMERSLSPDDVTRAKRTAERFAEAGAISGIIDRMFKKAKD